MAEIRTLARPTDPSTLTRRAVRDAVTAPLRARVPLLGGRRPSELPDLELVLEEAEIDATHAAAYDRICGFRVRDALPATYLHNLTFPLLMELLTDRAFPFPAVGLVHIANAIEQHRPVTIDERPTLRLRAANLRDHRAGRQFDVVAEATIDDERVWSETSTYLRRGAVSATSQRGDGTEPGVPAAEEPRRRRQQAPEPRALWRLPSDLGRRFAAVSGDANPIHTNALLAKALGMPSMIVHGMWLYARCLAAFEPRLTPALRFEGAFKRPVVLPATVGLSSSVDSAGFRTFAVHGVRSGTPHLAGTLICS